MPWVLVLAFIPEDELGASNAWAAWWPLSMVGGGRSGYMVGRSESAIVWSEEL